MSMAEYNLNCIPAAFSALMLTKPGRYFTAADAINEMEERFYMRRSKVYQIILTAMLVALGIIIPYFTGHAFGIPGKVLLPMHLPVFLMGFLCGPQYGAIGGLITPIISSLLTGMPALFPMMPIMAGELLTYGMVSGLIYRKIKLPLYPSLLISMICGRITYAIIFSIIVAPGLGAFKAVAGAVTEGLPGIAIQLVLVPAVVYATRKYFRNEMHHNHEKTECITLNYAIRMIKKEQASCVIIKDNNVIHTDKAPGIAPLIYLYENKPELMKNAFIVDKVIGKAAAMMAVLGGASKVYGVLTSKSAIEYLNRHNIPVEYGECIDKISNRAGDGICPLEETVMDLDDPAIAYEKLKETIKRLTKAV